MKKDQINQFKGSLSTPFSVIACNSLGVSSSCLEQMGSLIPSASFSRARLPIYYNILTQNLIIFDQQINLPSFSKMLDLRMVYNSKAVSNQWNWNIPQLISPGIATAPSITIRRSDGNILSLGNDGTNNFRSTTAMEGKGFLRFYDRQDCWIYYDPKTHFTDYFNKQTGLLSQRVDHLGRNTSYAYDSQSRLIKVTTGEQAICILYKADSIAVQQQQLDDPPFTLLSYKCTSTGQITQSTQTDGITINYAQDIDTYKIISSDGDYVEMVAPIGAEQTIRYGKWNNADLSSQVVFEKMRTGQISIIGANHRYNRTVSLNAAHKVSSIKQDIGLVPGSSTKLIQFEYAADGMLSKQSNSDGSWISWTYDSLFRLLTNKTEHSSYSPEKVTRSYYIENNLRPVLSCRTVTVGENISRKRWVYAKQEQTITPSVEHDDYQYAQYIVSNGCVTKYQHDSKGEIEDTRRYLVLTDLFDKIPDDQTLASTKLDEWSLQQKDFQLTTYDYDQYSQITFQKKYAAIKDQAGLDTVDMEIRQKKYDRYGNLEQCLHLQQPADGSALLNIIARTDYTFNAHGEILEQKGPLPNQHVTYAYRSSDQGVIINKNQLLDPAIPLELSTAKEFSTSGLLLTSTQADKIGGTTTVSRSQKMMCANGVPNIIVFDDASRAILCYALNGELYAEIDPYGTITTYDQGPNYKLTTRYAAAIDVSSLLLDGLFVAAYLPSAIEKIKNADKDLVKYTFYNLDHKVSLQVGVGGLIEQFTYHPCGAITSHTKYHDECTNEEIASLLQGKMLARAVDFTRDRVKQTIYSENGLKHFDIDSAGFVIEYQYDGGQNLLQEIKYATAVKMQQFSQISPPTPIKSERDTIIQKEFDGCGRNIQQVDEEGFVRTMQYDACSNIVVEKQFPSPGVPITQQTANKVITSSYDQASRLQRQTVDSLQIDYQYRLDGVCIAKIRTDIRASTTETGDTLRAEYWQYNPFGQITYYLSGELAAQYYQLSNTKGTTPQQLAALWAQSYRINYNAGGLILSDIQPRLATDPDVITRYLYDLNDRLVVIIDSMLHITIQSYDAFSCTMQRKCKKQLTTVDSQSIQPGLITAAINTLLQAYQVDATDQVTLTAINRILRQTITTDACGEIYTTTYNVFSEPTQEIQPLDSSTSLTIDTAYDVRGLPIRVDKTDSNKKTLTERFQYSERFTQKTVHLDALGHSTYYYYDSRSMLCEIKNSLQDSIEKSTYTNLGQLQQRTDAIGRKTTYSYDQAKNTVTQTLPSGRALITRSNVFAEAISIQKASGLLEERQHNAQGKVTTCQQTYSAFSSGNYTTQQTFDLQDRLTQQTTAGGAITQITRDLNGVVTAKIEDSAGLKASTHYNIDTFGNTTKTTSPNQGLCDIEYDKNNHITRKTQDPNQLAISNATELNAQGSEISTTISDAAQSITLKKQFLRDGFNRIIATIIDPDELSCKTAHELDGCGNITSITDGEGNKSLLFYNELSQCVVKVSPAGGVTSYDYDLMHRQIMQRQHVTGIDLTKISSITPYKDVMSLLTENQNDNLIHTVYNLADEADSCLQLEATGTALYSVVLIENSTDHSIQQVSEFSQPITYDDSQSFAALCAAVHAVAAQTARKKYKFYDEYKRLRFEVDSYNAVTEYCYNADNKPTQLIAYADAIDADGLVKLQNKTNPLPAIDFSKDRVSQKLWNALGFLVAEIDESGYVSQYTLDLCGNIFKKIQYKNPVPLEIYANLAAIPVELDEKNDIVTLFQRDAASRVTALCDGEHYVTSYKPNALSQNIAATRFMTAVTPKDDTFALPESTAEDQRTIKQYDTAARLRRINQSNGLQQDISYDKNHKKLTILKSDSASPGKGSDKQRFEAWQYDNCQRQIAHLTPLSGATYLDIENDSTLTPQEKATKISSLWQQQSERSSYTLHGKITQHTDSVGDILRFYYDRKGNCIYDINANGSLTHNQYDAFKQRTNQRALDYAFTDEQLEKLNGGYLDPDNAWEKLESASDHQWQLVYDDNGLLLSTTDPEGDITSHTYNLFKEKISSTKPLDKSRSVVTTYDYEQRGLCISETETGGDLTRTNTYQYHSPLGKQTQHIDPMHVATLQLYDCRGKLVKVQKHGTTLLQMQHDALSRPIQSSDAMGSTTLHDYKQGLSQHTITHPNRKQTISTLNVFSEVMLQINASGLSTTFEHNAIGKTTRQASDDGFFQTDEYNIDATLRRHVDANGDLTVYTYNGTKQVRSKAETTGNIKSLTEIDYSPLGNRIQQTEADGSITARTLNSKGQLLSIICDKEGASEQTAYENSATGDIQQYSELGDDTTPSYEVSFNQDNLGRITQRLISPVKEQLTTDLTLDLNDNICSATNAEGQKQRLFYNEKHQPVVVLLADNSVLYRCYDDLNRLTHEHYYTTLIDSSSLTDASNYDDVLKLCTEGPEDISNQFIYDPTQNGRITCSYNTEESVWHVSQEAYGPQGQVVANFQYADTLTVTQLSNDSTYAEIDALLSPMRSKARTNYRIRNTRDLVQFKINAIGEITEIFYDGAGRVCGQRQYVNTVLLNPSFVSISAENFSQQVKPSSVDRIERTSFNAFNLPNWHMQANGLVTSYQYNANGHLRERCEHATLIDTHLDVSELETKIQQLSSSDDRTVQQTIDYAGRPLSVTDARGSLQTYQRNRLGLTNQHTDRLEQNTRLQYDSVKRPVSVTHPQITCTLIQQDQQSKALAATTQSLSPVTNTTYTPLGQAENIVYAAGSDYSRSLSMQYNTRQQQTSISSEPVPLDNAGMPASLQTPPVTLQSVNQLRRYNQHGLCIVERKQNGQLYFYAYNNLGKKRYLVNVDGVVTESVYNTLGDVKSTIQYANRLSFKPDQYIETGISLQFVKANLKTDPADRKTDYQRNALGLLQVETKQEILCFDPETKKTSYAMPTIEFASDRFGACVRRSHLITRDPETWQHHLYWHDNADRIIAEAVSLTKDTVSVTVTSYTAFGEKEKVSQYATAIPLSAVYQLPFSSLEAQLKTDSTDRITEYTYDNNGNQLSHIQRKRMRANITLNSKKEPILQQTSVDLENKHQYDNLDRKIGTTLEDGTTTYKKLDSNGALLAELHAPVQTINAKGETITLYPMTAYGRDSFKKETSRTYHAAGASKEGQFTPISSDDSATELTLRDKRGLQSYKQNALGILTLSTHNSAGQVIRLINPHPGKDGKMHTDEIRYGFDVRGRSTQKSTLQDATLVTHTSTKYTTFGERCSMSNQAGEYYQASFDSSSNIWRDNRHEGVMTVYASDMLGRSTLQIQATKTDLSQLTADNRADFFTTPHPPEDVETTISHRDAAGRETKTELPLFQPSAIAKAQTIIPLQVSYKNGILSWPIPAEKNVTASFNISVKSAKKSSPLDIVVKANGRCEVDVSALPTDLYAYQINYFLADANGKAQSKQPMYQSTGVVGIITHGVGQYAVPRIDSGSMLHIEGAVESLEDAELWQSDAKVTSLNLSPSKTSCDLSAYPSGFYYLKVAGAITSSFYISTPVPAAQPRCTEWTCHPQLSVLDNHIDLNLLADFPPQWEPDSLLCTFVYEYIFIDPKTKKPSSKEATEKISITASTKTTPYHDKNDKILHANISLEHSIISIKSLSIVAVFGDETAALFDDQKPIADKEQFHVNRHGVLQPFILNEKPSDQWFDSFENENDQWVKVGTSGKPDPKSDSAIVCLHLLPRVLLNLNDVDINPANHLSYLDVSQDRMAEWKTLQLAAYANKNIVIDINCLSPGVYPYKLPTQSLTSKLQPNSLADTEYNMIVTHGEVVFPGNNQSSQPPPTSAARTRLYTHDRWGNVLQKTDANGNTSSFTWNDQNKLQTSTTPPVEVVSESGAATTQGLTTQYGYSHCGHKIATMKPGGQVKFTQKDSAGRVQAITLGDGTVTRRNALDAIGRVVGFFDATGTYWQQQWDKAHQLIARGIADKPESIRHYAYVLGHRTVVRIGDKMQSMVYRDPSARIIERIDALGHSHSSTYDDNHQLLSQQLPDGRQQTWKRNAQGREQAHTDLSGANYTISYDLKHQVIAHQGSGGQHGQDLQITLTEGVRYSFLSAWPIIICRQKPQDIAAKNLSMTYTAGRLTTVQDIAAGQITHFDYTNEDRRQMVGVTLNDGTVLRFAHSTLDAVGREIAIFDTLVSGKISYDLNGNRRRHQVTLFNPQTGTNQLCDHWFTYDHADRVLIANGALASGVISINAQQGLTRTYQNNQLMTETSANNQKSFAYNPNGSIKQLADDNSITNITYSPEGYTLQTVVISSTKTQTNTYAVDAQGHTTGSKQVTNTSTDNTSSSTFDVNGESVTRTTHDNTGDIPIEYDLTTQYAGFDSPQITAVAGHTNEKYGNAYTNCAVYHNPNGNISAKVGAHYGDGNGDPQAVIFTTTFDGIILRKLTLPSGNWLEIDPKDISTQGNFYTVDGNYICSAQMPYQENTVLTNVYANYMQQEISEHGPTNKDFNAEQTQLMGQLKQQQDIFNNPLTYLIGRYYGFSNEDIYRIHQHSIATFRDLFAKNFDGHSTRLLQVQEFVNAFDSSSLSSPPNQYIVQTNETFPAIAQIVYGDSSYAATLAEANGYAPSQTPDPGSQLMVPKMTSAHNTAHNYTPYDQITQSLIGPLYPNLKFAQPHHSCWQVILEVAISVFAVAISVCTLGAGTGVALALETAALAGLVDASAQELFCGIGLLDKFSWEDVVGAAASGGFGLGASSAAQSLSAGEKILHIAEAGMRLALEYGAVNIGVQLTQMSVGTRNHFDFKELLAVMATSAMASAFGKLKGLTESVVAGQLEEITENYISSMIYSAIADTKYSWTNATAALIGEETGGLVANRFNQQKIKNAQTAANDKYVTAMLHGAGIDLDPISNNPSHVPYAPLPNVHQPTPNTPQHSQPLALRTDYYNNHRNADYFTDNTPSPASVPARPSKPQAHAATPQKIAPKAQPAHADAKHSAKVSMRSIMDDATGLAQKSEACVKQAWGDVEKTVTHAWNHPKQDALRVFNDGTRVLHDFDSGLVDGAVSTVKNTAHAVATISQDIYHGAEITFTDPGQAWRNVEYDTAGIRTHISSVAHQAEQGVVTWSNHPTQAWHNVEINTANDAYKVANYANKEAHSLMNMNAYQIGEAVGSGVVIALPAIMTGGATAEAEAAGSVFAAAGETSGEITAQVGLFGRSAKGLARNLGAEAVESSQVAARSEQLAVKGGVFGRAEEEPKLFENQFPEHEVIDATNTLPNEIIKKINGRFNYIVTQNNELVVGKYGLIPGRGHIDLAAGNPVKAAGEVRIIDGHIKYIDNTSGHYLTSGPNAQQSAENAFNQLGFDTVNKYIEKLWIEDSTLPRGGAWRPQP